MSKLYGYDRNNDDIMLNKYIEGTQSRIVIVIHKHIVKNIVRHQQDMTMHFVELVGLRVHAKRYHQFEHIIYSWHVKRCMLKSSTCKCLLHVTCMI